MYQLLGLLVYLSQKRRKELARPFNQVVRCEVEIIALVATFTVLFILVAGAASLPLLLPFAFLLQSAKVPGFVVLVAVRFTRLGVVLVIFIGQIHLLLFFFQVFGFLLPKLDLIVPVEVFLE